MNHDKFIATLKLITILVATAVFIISPAFQASGIEALTLIAEKIWGFVGPLIIGGVVFSGIIFIAILLALISLNKQIMKVGEP
ncbi:hypothetical protein [Neptuniibacter sp. QD37_11]|uniref:hypothetical protein n=1 Tax=Neptuniibacter sp. QD37_11 TaxID=3398209 RepID=UPI0039F5EBEA